MSEKEEPKSAAESSASAANSPTGSARPNSLGTGSRSPSGTISITPSSSTEETNIKTRSQEDDEDALVPASDAPPTSLRPRLYSEEDEDLRKAKAMALAIQQHPNMTPEEIHQMHIGDEEQSQLLLEQQQQDKKPKSNDFLGSIRESQKKTKELFQTMVGTPSRNSSHGSSSSAPPAVQQQQQQVVSFTATTTTSSVRSTASQDTVDSKTGVISAAAVARRAAENFKDKASPAVAAVKDKASPAVAAVKDKMSSTSSSTKKKYPVIDAARARANSGVAAAKAKANSAKTKAKGVMTKKSSKSNTSPREMESVVASTNVGEESDVNSKIRLSANVWKRRGGMGKLSYSKAWERRKVILLGSKLFYFKMAEDEEDDMGLDEKDLAWFEQAAQTLDKAKGPWLIAENDPTAPRGYIDLLKEGTSVAASSGHSGAPSPFAISIKVKSDTVWKLCFDLHATQMEWLAAMTDVVVIASVDTYNANLLLAADPSHEATMFESEYLPPPGDKEAGQQLWMMGAYRVSSVGLDEFEAELVETDKEPDVSSTTASSDELQDADRWILQEKDVRALFAIVNGAIILVRSSSTTAQHFWYILTLCNVGLGFFLVNGYKKRDTSSAPAVVAASNVIKSIVDTEELEMEEEEEITVDKPVAGTTTVKLENPSDSPEIDGQVFGAWCAPPGENIAVRSHGYLTSKEKVPSPGELYKLVNVDIFESPHRYPDMARRVTLPKVEFEGKDPATKTWYAPDIFIVSVALPTDKPSMRSTDDGGGFTITMYFAMHQETRDILRRVTAESYDPLQEPAPEDVQKSKVNAVKLFEEYCRRAPTDPDFQSRFKLVANAQNLREIGMPNWIAKYNGKPVLIKRAGQTGFLFPHPNLSCMEFDVSFHPFPYIAKQAISYMKDNFFKKVLVTFGFVIEGRADDELPECVIGLMQLCYPDPQYAIQAADFFAGKSPRSF